MGAAGGIALLARTAAGDMYPPARRARGIALVLFGAVFGAILGPAVFGPLFAGEELEPEALMVPWLAAGGFMLVGLALVLAVRPDPKRIGELMIEPGHRDLGVVSAAPLREILRRPGVFQALLAAFASFSVMAALMNLVSYVVVTSTDITRRTSSRSSGRTSSACTRSSWSSARSSTGRGGVRLSSAG